MSHPQKATYLEDVRVRFDETKDGFSRATILRELRENGFDHEAEQLLEDWLDERRVHLESVGVQENEITVDDENKEFFIEQEELGSPGEDYQITEKRVEIPKYLDVDYWTLDVKK